MAALCSAQTGVNATPASPLQLEDRGSYFWSPLGSFTRVSIRSASVFMICFTVHHESRDNDIFQQLLVRHSEVCVQKRQFVLQQLAATIKEAPSGGIHEQRFITHRRQNASSMPSPSLNSRGFRYFLSDFDWQMLW